MSSAKKRSFCLGLNVLIYQDLAMFMGQAASKKSSIKTHVWPFHLPDIFVFGYNWLLFTHIAMFRYKIYM